MRLEGRAEDSMCIDFFLNIFFVFQILFLFNVFVLFVLLVLPTSNRLSFPRQDKSQHVTFRAHCRDPPTKQKIKKKNKSVTFESLYVIVKFKGNLHLLKRLLESGCQSYCINARCQMYNKM